MEKITSEESSRSRNLRSASRLGEGAVSHPSHIEGLPSMTEPGDAFETEADRVADLVVSGLGSSVSSSGESAVISAYGGTSGGVPHNMESQLRAARGGGMPLPSGLKSMMEGSFGRDLSSVRIHTDSAAASMSDSIDARAFTSGQDIYFNAGEFSPDTKQGQRLIAHEITHTLQQCGGIAREEKKKTPKPKVEVMDEEDLNEAAAGDRLFWARLLQHVFFLDTGVELPLYTFQGLLHSIKVADEEITWTRKNAVRVYLSNCSEEMQDKLMDYFDDDDWRFSIARQHARILSRQVPGGWNTTVAERQFRSLALQNKSKTAGRTEIDNIEYLYLSYRADRNANLNPFENPDFLVSGSTWTKIFGIEVALIASVFTAGVTGAIGASTLASVGVSIGVGTVNDLYQLAIEYSTAESDEDKKEIEDHLGAQIAGIVVKNAITGGFFRLGAAIGDTALADGVKALLGVLTAIAQESINMGVKAITTGGVDGGDAVSAGGNVAAGGFGGHGSAGGQTIGIIIPAVIDAAKLVYENSGSDTKKIPYSSSGYSLPGPAATYFEIMKSV